jgi:hypothetical protein
VDPIFKLVKRAFVEEAIEAGQDNPTIWTLEPTIREGGTAGGKQVWVWVGWV